MSSSDSCPKCGQEYRYIIRKKATHWISGKPIYPRNRRALRIRLCGCKK